MDPLISPLYFVRISKTIIFRAKRDGLNPDSLNKYFTDNPLGKILKHTAKGIFLLEIGEKNRALDEVDCAIRYADQDMFLKGALWSLLYQVKGDATYNNNPEQAEESYEMSLKHSILGSFEYAWSCWRLGLLKDSEDMLEQAATSFRDLEYIDMWSRALGARGALLIHSKQHLEGLQCLQEITETYFIEKETLVGPAVTVALAHITRLSGFLKNDPIPESDPNFPNFKARVFEDILENAQPKAGPVVAFYYLAEAYENLGNQLNTHSCLKTALSFDPEHEFDKRIVLLVIKKTLDVVIDSDSENLLLKRCVQLTLKCRSLGIQASLPNLSDILFGQVDIGFENNLPFHRIEKFLEMIEKALVDHELDRDHWESEILIRRARLLQACDGDKSALPDLYRKGFAKGIVSQNASVIISSAHVLGFQLANFTKSMKELSKYHIELIRGIEIQGLDYDRLTVIGGNLFSLWRKLDYRRLLESDLNTKKHLYDSAKEMHQSNVPDKQAGIVMVLLLSSLFNHIGPSVDWAKGQLEIRSGLPEHVTSLLEPLFRSE